MFWWKISNVLTIASSTVEDEQYDVNFRVTAEVCIHEEIHSNRAINQDWYTIITLSYTMYSTDVLQV